MSLSLKWLLPEQVVAFQIILSVALIALGTAIQVTSQHLS